MITDSFTNNTKCDSEADDIQEEEGEFKGNIDLINCIENIMWKSSNSFCFLGNQEEVTAVRKVYVKRVSSLRQQTIRLPRQGQNLFEALLLIGLDQDLKLGKVPYVKSKYPESVIFFLKIINIFFFSYSLKIMIYCIYKQWNPIKFII